MKKTGRNKGLTLRDVVNHISNFKQEVNTRFDTLEKRLSGKIDSLEVNLQLLRSDFRSHCKGVDDLDFRVQDIEEEDLPKRVRVMEEKLQIAV